MRRALDEVLSQSDRIRTSPQTDPSSLLARAFSSSRLDLGTTTFATLRSVDEVNSTETGFSPNDPTWVGSTAQATLSGSYNGFAGSGTMTFRVDQGGIHGQDNLIITVLKPNGLPSTTISINSTDPIDQQYNVGNGLKLTLGAGRLIKDTSFNVQVTFGLPSSYSPTNPEWQGSTAPVTVGGTYDGSSGTGPLTFRVTQGGTHGQDNLVISEFASDGTLLDTVTLFASDPLSQTYTLSNGLTLNLGSGTLITDEEFTVDVQDGTIHVDRPFNGTGNNSANLESGQSVTDGSFLVNGVSIDVSAADTVNAVLDRITQSAAGVTAAFDAVTETVMLTQNSPGLTKTITLGADTSGFLSAVKLAGAVVSEGNGNLTTPIADVQNLAWINSGTVLVNGMGISFDVNSDSLTDVLERISAAGAGVSAWYQESSGRVFVVGNSPLATIQLDSNGTGLFSTLGIADGTYQGQPAAGSSSRRGVSRTTASEIAQALNDAAHALNGLFDDLAPDETPSPELLKLRADIQSAFAGQFDSSGPRYETGLGLRFDFGSNAREVFRFTSAVQQRLLVKLKTARGTDEFREVFLGNGSDEGLLERLDQLLDRAETELTAALASAGLFVDVRA